MAKPRRQTWVWVATAILAGLVLRMYFVVAAPRLSGDTLLYGDIAKNLIQHHVYGFTVTGGASRPTLIRVPGYPLFLALCFEIFGMEHYQAVLYLQVAIDLATCLLVADLARRSFGARAGLSALWTAALCPFTANYVAAALTETLTLFCIAAAFYGMQRWRELEPGFNRWLGIVAAALAYSVLLRPEQGLLAAAVIPGMLSVSVGEPRKAGPETLRDTAQHGVPGSGSFGALPVIVAAICVVLPLVPWAIRNERTFQVFQPLAPRFANDPGEQVPLGFQRWYRTWAIDFTSTENVYWNYDGDDINISDLPNRAFYSDAEYDQVGDLLNSYNADDKATPELDGKFDRLAQERIDADPVRYYLVLPMARLLNMMLRPRTEMMSIGLEWWKWSVYRWQTVFASLYATLNLAYFAAAGFALYRMRSHWNAVTWSMLAYIALRCALLLTLDNSEPRYTIEFFPMLCAFSSMLFTERGGATVPSACTHDR